MIILNDVWVKADIEEERISGLTGRIPTDRRLAILSSRRGGKAALLRLLGGLQKPHRGTIERHANVSFPLGRPLGLIRTHSLRRNCVLAARLYRLNAAELVSFVARVADFGDRLDVPVEKLRPAEAGRFRYTLCYALPFETFLIDGDPYPRDTAISPALEGLISQRINDSGLIIVTSSSRLARKYCDEAAVYAEGKLRFFDSFERAVATFQIVQEREDGSGMLGTERLYEASRALRKGDLDTVEAIAEAELEEYGDTGLAFWLFAELSLANGDRGTAISQILQACKLAPDASEPWSTLIKLGETEDDRERALDFADLLLQHDDPNIKLSGSKILARFGDLDAALRVCRELSDKHANKLDIGVELAEFEIKAGSHEKAHIILERLLASNPNSWRVLYAKVRVEVARGNSGEAELAIERLKLLRPDIAQRSLRLLKRGAEQGGSRSPSNSEAPASRGLAEAERAFERNDYVTLAQAVNVEAVTPSEQATKAWLLGELALAQGDRRKGVSCILKACRLGPQAEKPWAALCRIAEEEQEASLAMAFAKALLTHTQTIYRKAGAKIMARYDISPMRDAWQRVAEGEACNPAILLEVADAETRGQRHAEAIALLDLALIWSPDLTRAIFAKAKNEWALGRLEDLAQTLVNLKRLRPELIEHFLRHVRRDGKPEVLEQVFSALKDTDPEFDSV